MSSDEQILNYHDAQLYKTDVQLFINNEWLNDQCINFYFTLIYYRFCNATPEVLLLDPSVIAFVLFQADAEDLSEMRISLQLDTKKLILIPANNANLIASGGSHWSLLSYDVSKNLFQHYDSSGNSNYDSAIRIIEKFSLIMNKRISASDNLTIKECPQQANAYDCGIYVILVAEWICKVRYCNLNLTLEQFIDTKRIKDTRESVPKLVAELLEAAKT